MDWGQSKDSLKRQMTILLALSGFLQFDNILKGGKRGRTKENKQASKQASKQERQKAKSAIKKKRVPLK